MVGRRRAGTARGSAGPIAPSLRPGSRIIPIFIEGDSFEPGIPSRFGL